ncbi:MAG: DUF2336 domain-containing protein, partial [Alphaproteobacteria bacterium]
LKRLLNRGHAIVEYEKSKTVASGGDVRTRRRLAARDDARPEILYYLAEDEDPKVRRAIAANPATPRQADAQLAGDRDDDVRCELARKIGRLAPELSEDTSDKIARLTLQVLDKLAADQLPRVRRIVAEEIKRCGNLPRGLVRRLALDAEIAVAAPVLEYSPLLSDQDLLEIIASEPIRGALSAIARRAMLGDRIAEVIVDADDDDAIADLLRNQSAQIREETLDLIIDRAPPKEAWHTPMVRRGELSVRAVARVATFVSFALLRALEERHDLPPDAIKEVRKVVRERIESGLADGDPAAPDARVDTQAFASANDDVLVDAITGGDVRFVKAALAAKAGLSPERVDRILGARNGKAVTALVWKAGLAMRTAVMVQIRIAGIPPDKVLNARDGVDYPLSAAELDTHFQLIS